MKKFFPVLLAIIGLAMGTAAGKFLRPTPEETAMADPDHATAEGDHAAASENSQHATGETATEPVRRSDREHAAPEGIFEYVKLNNQFVVPVVSGAKVSALVVLSLSIEVSAGQKEIVFEVEPKLRDSFLQVLFNHANSGGFDGAFTAGEKMSDLRGALFEAAFKVLGPIVSDVLVIDIVRQDV